MEKPYTTGSYIKLVLFVLLLIAGFLLFIALLFGRYLGYKMTLAVCIGTVAIIIVVFSSIIMLNLTVEGIIKLKRKITEKKRITDGH
jgi:hypothetical protein